jgi:long-chain acyl-CoA synthetase
MAKGKENKVDYNDPKYKV